MADTSDYTSLGNVTRAGTVDVTIVDADISETEVPPSGELEIHELGEIEYDNAVPDDGDEPKALGMDGGSIEITFWETVKLSDGTTKSLLEHFEQASASEFPFEVDLMLTVAGTDYDFRFKFGYTDIDFDEIGRKLTISCSSRNNLGDDSQDFLEYARTKSDPDDFQGSDRFTVEDNLDAIPTGRVVRDALFEIYGLSTTVVSPRFGLTNPTDGADEWYMWMTDPDGSQVYSYNYQHTLNDAMFTLALMEGAYFGCAFGSGFFVTRNHVDPEEHVNVDWSEVEDLEVVRRRNLDMNTVRSAILVHDFDNVFPQGNNGSYSNWNPDYLTVADHLDAFATIAETTSFTSAFPKYTTTPFTYDSTTETLDFTSQSKHDSMMDGLARDSADAYATTLGASAPFRVELTIWGVTTVLPWQTFSLTNAPSKYTGKDLGIGNISYDLVNDKITAEVFEI